MTESSILRSRALAALFVLLAAVHCSDEGDTMIRTVSGTMGNGGNNGVGGHGGTAGQADGGAAGAIGGTAGTMVGATSGGGAAGATGGTADSNGGAAGSKDGGAGSATDGGAGKKGGAGGSAGVADSGLRDAHPNGPPDKCAANATPAAGCMPGSFCELFTEGMYNCFFPQAKAPYSYAGLVSAADKYYPAFTRTGDLYMRKREASAFLANIAHETVGLQYAEEVACSSGKCFTNQACAPYLFTLNGTQKCYDGRGAIQLTTYENYRLAETALGGLGLMRDIEANPELVATDPEIAIATAIWFWMERTNRTIGCHTAIVGEKGFGITVIEINGPIECGVTQGIGFDEWKDRLSWFSRLTNSMGIDTGDISGCN
jgi:Chitinase class I